MCKLEILVTLLRKLVELVIPMILVKLLILVNMLIIICNNFDDSGESLRD